VMSVMWSDVDRYEVMCPDKEGCGVI